MDQDQDFAGLMAKVRAGDARAAADIVKLYEPEVRRFVRYRLNSPRMRRFLDSVDICQSVFGNLFARLADGQFDLQHPRQLGQLLVTMAGNKLLDHVRKQSTQQRGGGRAASGLDAEAIADSGPGPSRALEAQEVVDIVRARMTPEESVVLDQWMHGEDWQGIAERCGGSPEAIRKRLTRALDRVAGEFGWGDSNER